MRIVSCYFPWACLRSIFPFSRSLLDGDKLVVIGSLSLSIHLIRILLPRGFTIVWTGLNHHSILDLLLLLLLLLYVSTKYRLDCAYVSICLSNSFLLLLLLLLCPPQFNDDFRQPWPL